MKVIFILNKKIFFFEIISIPILLILLFTIYFKVENKAYKNQLYFYIKTNNSLNISKEKIEEINQNKFLLTYETNQNKTISTQHSKKQVFFKEINYNYMFIMGYNILQGSFFTKEMNYENNKAIVLNKFAAFKLFGGIDIINNEVTIDSRTYFIIGIIDDYDEKNLNVYSISNKTENDSYSFIAFIDMDMDIDIDKENGVTEQFIKNELKQFGITEDNYIFINLQLFYENIFYKCKVGILLFILVLLILLLEKLTIKVYSNNIKFKNMLLKFYPKDIIKNNSFFVFGLLLNLFLFLVNLICIFVSLVFIIRIILQSNFFVFNIININLISFTNYILYAKDMIYISNIYFVLIVMLFLLFLFEKIKKIL